MSSSLSQPVRVRTPPGEALRIVCHVAVVDHRAQRVAASITPAGWLLPTAIFPPRTTQRDMILRACAALPMAAVPRCLGFAHIDRVAESIDYTLIADIQSGRSHGARGGADQMIDCGLLSASPALVPYQRVAWNRFARSSDARSLALQPSWFHTMTSWASQASGLAPPDIGSLIKADIYRANERRIVAALEIGGRVLHFKTSAPEPFVEAEVTRMVAAARPAAVPRTIAFDAARGWWLTEHVDGVPLTGDLWPAHLQAAATWIDLDRSLRDQHPALRAAGVVRLDRQRLIDAAQQAVLAIEHDDPHGRVATDTMARMHRLLATPAYEFAPEGLLHFDAASRNILQSSHMCVFLDLEAAYIGPSIICGALMGRRMKDQLSIAQRHELSGFAAATCLRDAGLEMTPSVEHISALTDLCLLAFHHGAVVGDANGVTDLPSALYGWTRVSADFLSRSNGWRI